MFSPYAPPRRAMQEKYLAEIGERFATPVLQIPLLPQEVKGLEMLAVLGERIFANGTPDEEKHHRPEEVQFG